MMPTHSQTSIRQGLLLSLRVLVLNLSVALVLVAALVLIVATAAHAEGGCGAAEVEQLHNEGRTLAQEEQLRAENHSSALPDCRAYELVTPPFKAGEPVFGHAFSESRLIFSSLGGFGEVGDNVGTGGGLYLASRGEAGWGSAPAELSATEFADLRWGNGEAFVDASSDLSAEVFTRTPIASNFADVRLYIDRLGPGGGVSEIGPMVPPSAVAAWNRTSGENLEKPEPAYVGATPDLSHVLFRIRRYEGSTPGPDYFLWPGDSTVSRFSLYEYVGAGHDGLGGDAPMLVGVSDGTTVVDGATIPAGQLISECGTTIGAANGEGFSSAAQNAISQKATPQEAAEDDVSPEEGAEIFFTALARGCVGRDASGEGVGGTGPIVNQLFARVNAARTISISEPTKADCTECDTTEAENPALSKAAAIALQADFEGASSTGSRVFFLSQQKLFPGKGEGANLYEYNLQGPAGHKLALIATDLPPINPTNEDQGLVRIAPEGNGVYFVSKYHAKNTEVPLATNRDATGQTAQQTPEDADDLYSYNTTSHRYTFIAELAAGDQSDWQSRDTGRTAEVTPDGRYLLFESKNDITPDASGSDTQLYRYDAQTGEENAQAEEEGHTPTSTPLTRITIGQGGYNQNGNAPALEPPTIITPTHGNNLVLAHPEALSMSDDGSKIFFTSPLGLTPQALNNTCVESVREVPAGECPENPDLYPAQNLYEYENNQIYLISDGTDRHSGLDGQTTVGIVGTTPSGNDVFFKTADSLVPEDTDSAIDIYDARVDGGVPAPPAAAPGCGEGCQGAPATPPVFGAPASATLSGSGNLAPPPAPAVVKQATKKKVVKCAKGKQLTRGKCVKSKGKRQRSAGRRSSVRQSNRRSN